MSDKCIFDVMASVKWYVGKVNFGKSYRNREKYRGNCYRNGIGVGKDEKKT